MTIAAAFFVAVLAAGAFAQDLPKIAVYVTGNFGEDEKKALGTRILASLVNSGRYRGIERASSFIAEIDREMVKQRSGAIDDNQISALGKQFGVKYVCIADITPVLGSFQVSARIVDVETAEVAFIGESYSQLKNVVDLVTVSDQVVQNMFGSQTATFRRRKTDPPPEATKPEPPKPEPPKPEPPKPEPPKPEPPKTYTLTVNAAPANGGTVSRSPNYAYYIAGTQVTVTAAPSYGYTFAGWSGASLSTSASLIVTMSGDAALTARFSRLPPPKPEPRPPKPAPAAPKPEPPPPVRQAAAPESQKRISLGGGVFYAYEGGGGIEWANGDAVSMPYSGAGAYLFLDHAYAEIFAGYHGGGGRWESYAVTYQQDLPDMKRSYLNIGAFAKIPFGAGRIKAFPLLGLDYEASTAVRLVYDDGREIRFEGGEEYFMSALWFKLGVGADMAVSEKAYLRAELVCGWRTTNSFERNEAGTNGARTRQGSGAAVRIGAGLRL